MSLRSIARTASLVYAVTGALLAVAASVLVQACGGDTETKDGTLPASDASSEGAAGAAGEGGSEDASPDYLVIDAPTEAQVEDVVPQDDVSLDVIPAE